MYYSYLHIANSSSPTYRSTGEEARPTQIKEGTISRRPCGTHTKDSVTWNNSDKNTTVHFWFLCGTKLNWPKMTLYL